MVPGVAQHLHIPDPLVDVVVTLPLRRIVDPPTMDVQSQWFFRDD